jgi:glycosyltransferase involved in cell wall biosynthesis
MLDVHLLAFEEAQILPWTIAHYRDHCRADRIIVHDGGSDDGTLDVAVSMGAIVKPWNIGGHFNDADNVKLKNECWAGSSADWVVVADADELLWSPAMPFPELLEQYEGQGIPIAKPSGFELCADAFPVYQPGRQLIDLVKHGAPDDHWYAKRILFTPRRVMYMNFSPGAHGCDAVLSNGSYHGNPRIPTAPPVYLLHAKHLGPVERIAERYQRNQDRHSDMNRRMRWGNFEAPLKHAEDKRRGILSNLRQIIP